MVRLKHRKTGEIFGYDANMAASGSFEVIDDGAEGPSAEDVNAPAVPMAVYHGDGTPKPPVAEGDLSGDNTRDNDSTPQQIRAQRIASGLEADTGGPSPGNETGGEIKPVVSRVLSEPVDAETAARLSSSGNVNVEENGNGPVVRRGRPRKTDTE